MRKKLLLGLLFFLLLGLGCWYGFFYKPLYKDLSYQGIDFVQVTKVPSGFMPLGEAYEKYKDLIEFFLFESQIAIIDFDRNNLKQTSIGDSSFVVQYKNDIFINESALQPLLPRAKEAIKEQTHIYSLGEPITSVDSQGGRVTVTVRSVTYS